MIIGSLYGDYHELVASVGCLSLHLARDPRYSRDSRIASRKITDISADSQD